MPTEAMYYGPLESLDFAAIKIDRYCEKLDGDCFPFFCCLLYFYYSLSAGHFLVRADFLEGSNFPS